MMKRNFIRIIAILVILRLEHPNDQNNDYCLNFWILSFLMNLEHTIIFFVKSSDLEIFD